MKTDSNLLAYYVEFVDSNGMKHYAVHKYRKTDGWVWSMRDYKFPGLQYDKKCNRKNGSDNMEVNNPTITIDAKPKWDPNMPMPTPKKYWCVYDKSSRLIAKFLDKSDADEYVHAGGFTVKEEQS